MLPGIESNTVVGLCNGSNNIEYLTKRTLALIQKQNRININGGIARQ